MRMKDRLTPAKSPWRLLAMLAGIASMMGIALIMTQSEDLWAISHKTSERVEAHGADIFQAQAHDESLPSNNRVKVGTGWQYVQTQSQRQ